MSAFLKFLALEEYLPAYTQAGWRPEQVGLIPFMGLTLAFTVFIYILEAYLDWRQLRTFYTTKSLPKELVNHISDETFRKSNAYGKDKFSFKIIESGFTFIQGVAFIILGYLPYAWDQSRSIADRMGVLTGDYSNLFQEIVITWVFIIITSVVDTVISMPFSLYGTFVVEEKHGFNKTTLALFFQDKIMTLGLTFLLGMPILSLVIWIIRIGGPHFYYYVWACLCVVSIILMTVYPTLIAPLFNKYTKLEDGEVKTAIEELAKSVEFPLTNLFTVDGSRRSAHSNAYFYGFFKVCFLFSNVVYYFPFSLLYNPLCPYRSSLFTHFVQPTLFFFYPSILRCCYNPLCPYRSSCWCHFVLFYPSILRCCCFTHSLHRTSASCCTTLC
jgi:STE24 endopeptidase